MNDSNEGTPGARCESFKELSGTELGLSSSFSRNNMELISIAICITFGFSQLFYKQLILHSERTNDIGLHPTINWNPKLC